LLGSWSLGVLGSALRRALLSVGGLLQDSLSPSALPSLSLHPSKKIFKKLKIAILYVPIILLLGIYSGKMQTQTGKDICTSMFIAELFTIVKT